MLLTDVVKDLEFEPIKGDLDREVNSIAYDSREVVENGLFVAISGFKVDGHGFIEKAIEMGATTIIVEKDVWVEDYVTILKVADSRKALACVSANFYQNPTEKFNLIGITGTNGKTSITYFLKSIFEEAQKSVGLIGTIGTVIDNKLMKNQNTTPESLNLQKIFTDMVDAGTDDCIMEVSSHALSLNRVAYCNFNTGIFTNLTPDHLELHHNMEDYFQAKALLFDMTQDYNIINNDDPCGKRLIDKIKDYDTTLITYGMDSDSDIYASEIRYFADYTLYTVNTPKGNIEVRVNIPGDIYVYNSLAAIACAYCHNIDLKVIQKGISDLEGIKGRMEVVFKDKDYKIVIDFAHTEDGLEKALTSLRPYTKGKLIVVFGVYAPDDKIGKLKRRAMGKVAAKYADLVIVTSDNPKDLDPNFIIDEIVEGVEEENGDFKVFVDRLEAIQYAIHVSTEEDTILIAGKGHETAQIVGKKEIPFNEAEIVKETLRNRKLLVF
ncbi:UDP-N-acetylmuramoyl-L-alanyl-D-glutamate--2,6-diaminopimelate ligase [Bacillus sp. MUM 116]|uniref:UDP-N-acetylmuramoyl-L-alanyl-D-glutamate--2, 6-diaminopimelate ligase n=1 Tax=Bacillus sp. MUM 116 TaxID=1678002 RepID=UPI0008F5BE97|nr:UDP-N-acetylmuramoyl-L-alanyl-D-glutamate--2,6-diaminopimelate ligase [Bacillus sp. MUM 116]OIK09670.1 UDP-N-acetylmuramoyl-L-alanyl-D-glutamate--2,6-diaminopimelate ligase [Bacillus sp. MUM 116]